MKIWKKDACFLLVLGMALNLAACGRQKQPGQVTEENQTEVPAMESIGPAASGEQMEDGRGDLILEEGDAVPILMGGALPFTNMQSLRSENYEDGTYYYADVTEDGQTMVVNTALLHDPVETEQMLQDYLTSCALALGDADTGHLQSVEENDAYTEQMSYPVYLVTYTAGENEDTREWTVFAMDTDCCTYLYGFCTIPDAADDMESVYQDVFAGLYLSDGE